MSPLSSRLPDLALKVRRARLLSGLILNIHSPALTTSGAASSSYVLKFSKNSLASSATSFLKSASPAFHDFWGLRICGGTPVTEMGTWRLKVSKISNLDLASSPEWIASTIARVYFSLFEG
jgi:hypothetical protein